jgi:hypothetical protein
MWSVAGSMLEICEPCPEPVLVVGQHVLAQLVVLDGPVQLLPPA